MPYRYRYTCRLSSNYSYSRSPGKQVFCVCPLTDIHDPSPALSTARRNSTNLVICPLVRVAARYRIHLLVSMDYHSIHMLSLDLCYFTSRSSSRWSGQRRYVCVYLPVGCLLGKWSRILRRDYLNSKSRWVVLTRRESEVDIVSFLLLLLRQLITFTEIQRQSTSPSTSAV